MCGDGEGEARVHAGRIALHGGVDEALHAREGHDLVELPRDLGSPHPENGAVERDVLAPCQFRVKSGADLEQRSDTADDGRVPLRGLGDAREDLQERALARAIAPDDAERLTLVELEGDVVEHPDPLVVARRDASRARADGLARSPQAGASAVGDDVANRLVGLALPDAIDLAEFDCADRDIAHRSHNVRE